MPPTATPAPASASSDGPRPMGSLGNWKMVFDDEFDGDSLDASKWTTCYPWFDPKTGGTNKGNNELQWYLPDGVSVSDGTLKLTAQKRTVTGTDGKTYNYTSGMISSGPSKGSPARFSYQYGFIESRMKLPRGKGMWPAFWTLPDDASWPPEVDGMEQWGNPNQITMNVHWRDSSGNKQDMSTLTGPDFTAEFHTIGVSWTPEAMVWYLDGREGKTFTRPAGIPSKPMYLILNLAIDGGNAPDKSTRFPGTMEVDYVRAWTK